MSTILLRQALLALFAILCNYSEHFYKAVDGIQLHSRATYANVVTQRCYVESAAVLQQVRFQMF